nr:MAG TPA_asm: hypothetical protein [Caudoviricetes sp.]DAY07151.1 MAG TPA: hypothetical protein [Caudoviricetes sp.]
MLLLICLLFGCKTLLETVVLWPFFNSLFSERM